MRSIQFNCTTVPFVEEQTIVGIYDVTSQLVAKQLVTEAVAVKHEKATNTNAASIH